MKILPLLQAGFQICLANMREDSIFFPEQSKCSKSGPNAYPMTAILVLCSIVMNVSSKRKKKRSIPKCESMRQIQWLY